MAEFYRGFVFELDVAAPLTVEGKPVQVEDAAAAERRREVARKLIDEEYKRRWKQTKKQLAILRLGVDQWNDWRTKNPHIQPMLAYADLRPLTPLDNCDFSYANLCQAKLQGVSLRKATFHQANLAKADLTGADLTGANFCRTDLYQTNFTGSHLIDANLQGVQLVENDFAGAELVGCKVFGVSTWDVKLKLAKRQQGFVIRYRPECDENEQETGEEEEIVENNLEMAGFTYMALKNRNLATLFNSASEKWVLLLGRFSERKMILKSLARALKKEQFIPIIFDFPVPERRDLIETVLLLAGMSAFVIVDLTNPSSTPLELQTIVPNYGVPIIPIIEKGSRPFAMFSGLRKFDWVFAPLEYDTPDNLVAGLRKGVIEPATAKAKSLVDWKTGEQRTRNIHEYI